jgi:hypothetical protein
MDKNTVQSLPYVEATLNYLADAAPRESIEVRALVFFAPAQQDAESVTVSVSGSTTLSAK